MLRMDKRITAEERFSFLLFTLFPHTTYARVNVVNRIIDLTLESLNLLENKIS